MKFMRGSVGIFCILMLAIHAALAQRVAKPAEVFGNPISTEADAWLTDANTRYNESVALLKKTWLANTKQVTVSPDSHRLVFTGSEDKVTFDALIIGTVRRSDRSWEWAWNNPNLPNNRVVPAKKLHELAAKFDLRYLKQGMVPVPMQDFPLLLSAITLKLHGGSGAYMVPSDNGLDVYFLLSNPRR